MDYYLKTLTVTDRYLSALEDFKKLLSTVQYRETEKNLEIKENIEKNLDKSGLNLKTLKNIFSGYKVLIDGSALFEKKTRNINMSIFFKNEKSIIALQERFDSKAFKKYEIKQNKTFIEEVFLTTQSNSQKGIKLKIMGVYFYLKCFCPEMQGIFNNIYITAKEKTLFYKEYFDAYSVFKFYFNLEYRKSIDLYYKMMVFSNLKNLFGLYYDLQEEKIISDESSYKSFLEKKISDVVIISAVKRSSEKLTDYLKKELNKKISYGFTF
jgi:hypothetical protein